MSALSLSLYNSHPVECSRGEGEGEHMTMTMMIGNLARLCRERERERAVSLCVLVGDIKRQAEASKRPIGKHAVYTVSHSFEVNRRSKPYTLLKTIIIDQVQHSDISTRLMCNTIC